MFDLDFTKLLLLAVVALVVFGPERLPGLAAQAGRSLRQLRLMLDGAKSELQENLGPEFSNFDVTDLNPRHFVRKHLVDELAGDGVVLGRDGIRISGTASSRVGAVAEPGPAATALPAVRLEPDELPPFDMEAT